MMARLALGHPSRKRLAVWLDASDAAPAITEHLETCERCAERLEHLADVSLDDDDIDGQIGDALREAYAAPDGISDRVLRSIDARERADREMNLLLGLFSIAKDAAELMLPDDDDRAGSDEQRHREEPS